jgi:hypothetical protein
MSAEPSGQKPTLDYYREPRYPRYYMVGFVAWRLCAVYCFLQAITVLVLSFEALVAALLESPRFGRVGSADLLVVAGPLAAYLVTGTLLWRKSDRLARWLLRGEATETDGAECAAADLQPLAFSVAGAVVVAWTLPPVVCTLILWLRGGASFSTSSSLWFDGGLLSSGLQLLAGLVLFLGAKGLSDLWRKIQYRYPEPSELPPEQAEKP